MGKKKFSNVNLFTIIISFIDTREVVNRVVCVLYGLIDFIENVSRVIALIGESIKTFVEGEKNVLLRGKLGSC